MPKKARSKSRSQSRGRKKTVDTPASPKKTPRSTSRSKAKKSADTSTPVATPNSTAVIERKSRSTKKAVQVTDSKSEQVETKTTASRSSTTKVSTPRISDSRAAKLLGNKGPTTWWSVLGIVIGTICLSLFPIYVNMACPGKTCDFFKLPKITYNIYDYVDLKASIGVVVFLFAHVLISLLPFGKVVDYGKIRYRNNGLLALFVTVAAFGIAVYLRTPILYLRAHWIQALRAAGKTAFFISVVLAIRARKAPRSSYSPEANGEIMNDWFFGRELHPHVGPVNVKIALITTAACAYLWTVNSMLAEHVLTLNTRSLPNLSLLAVVIFQNTAILDIFVYQDGWSTMADMRNLGCGFMATVPALVYLPFVYSLQSRYILAQASMSKNSTQPLVPLWTLGIAVAIHFIGYFIYRASNTQKDEFRKNPYNPKLSHLSSIPTPDGRRLLASGWWGWVRHPNYLGDLVMSVAWSLPCGFKHFWPWMYPLYLVVMYAFKIHQDEKQCSKKHGAAYDQYCKRVPHRIIPHLF